MALRDVRAGDEDVLTTARLSIKPTGTEEWAIHNIYFEAECEFYRMTSGTELLFHTETAAGVLACHDFHVNATHYIEVKNTNAATKTLAYDGVLTHV